MESDRFQTIQLTVEDGVAWLSLQRPEFLNAFNAAMVHELRAAFDATDADPDVKAVIITGAGRAFCAGADLSEGGATFDYDAINPDRGPEADRDGGGLVALRIYESLKPVIVAFNGAAVGVGVTMTLPADIRLAATTAKFGFVFARRGIVPEAASSYFLPRIVGISQALEWTMTGRIFDANEALAGGLVRSVHEPDELLGAAEALAREIVDNTAPVSVTLSRHLLWSMLDAEHPIDAHRLDSPLVADRGRTADAHEGVVSFLEKRPASFPGQVPDDLPTQFPWRPVPPFRPAEP